MRGRLPATALLIVVLAILAGPASIALAQGSSPSPFSPLPAPTGSAPTTTSSPLITPTTTSTSAGGTFSGSAAVGIAVGAVILLGGISYFIWRDARRRAPVRHAHATAGSGGRSGSKPPIKPRKLSPAERRRRKRGRAR